MPKSSERDESSQNTTLLHASAEGVKFLVLLQILSRLLTFAVNQFLLRYLSPELLGISIQFELYMITILYFSRESLRTAIQRYGIDANSISAPKSSTGERDSTGTGSALIEGTLAAQAQTVVNLAYIPVHLGVVFTAAIAPYYVKSFVSEETASQPYFYESVLLYTVATLLELLSEPGFALAQQMLLYRLRASAESAAALTRCIVTCGFTVFAAATSRSQGGGLGPLPFALGQLGYAVVLSGIYLGKAWGIADREGFGLGLRKIAGEKNRYYVSYFNEPLCTLAFTMWVQAAIKHILTQGDSLLIAWLATTYDQGIYALASNYGSLIARMLFQPLEESSRNLFAKLLSETDKNGDADPSSIRTATSILQNILRLYGILSVFFFSLGPPLAPLLLQIVAGSRWSGSAAGSVLSTFCYYIPLLAINGITEAFVQSVATSQQLRNQSIWMFGFSVGLGMAGYVFLKELGWGAQGLVWANAVNMSLRIVWSSWFMSRYFKKNNAEGMFISMVLPDWRFVATAAVVGQALRRMKGLQMLSLVVIGKVGVLGILLTVVWYVFKKYTLVFSTECLITLLWKQCGNGICIFFRMLSNDSIWT